MTTGKDKLCCLVMRVCPISGKASYCMKCGKIWCEECVPPWKSYCCGVRTLMYVPPNWSPKINEDS